MSGSASRLQAERSNSAAVGMRLVRHKSPDRTNFSEICPRGAQVSQRFREHLCGRACLIAAEPDSSVQSDKEGPMVSCRAGNSERRLSQAACRAPQMVIGGGIHQLPPNVSRQLRLRGWQLHVASDAAAARRMARQLQPEVVVLPTASTGESAMLTCAKLRYELPETRLVVVGPQDDALARFARFAGANDYWCESSPQASVNQLLHDDGTIAC